jgi:polar amino acid transport system substrate-binding protein/glutamate/aspartate transport system substrate-binding protein
MTRRARARRAAALLLLGLAAGPAPAGAAPAAAAAVDRLQEMAERGTLRLGFREDAPPFSYRGAEGAPAGLAVRLCAAAAPEIAAAAGAALETVWVPVTASTRFEALETGRIDLLCGPTTQTLSRRERMDFTILYFVDGAGLVFRKGGPERLLDLTDDPVGVLAGTTTEALARRLLSVRAPGAELVLFESHVTGLEALQQGDIEAYMGDRSILVYQLGRMRPLAAPVISPRALSREPYALALPRGESGLRLAADRALSRIYASGRIFEMIRSALGGLEVGPETRAIYEVVTIPE